LKPVRERVVNNIIPSDITWELLSLLLFRTYIDNVEEIIYSPFWNLWLIFGHAVSEKTFNDLKN